MASRIEAVMEHLTYTKGVLGVVLCTTEGVPIRDSFQHLDRSIALNYAELAANLARQAALLYLPVVDEDEEPSSKKKKKGAEGDKDEGDKGSKSQRKTHLLEGDAVELIRVRSLMNEIIVKRGDDFLIVVVQESGE